MTFALAAPAALAQEKKPETKPPAGKPQDEKKPPAGQDTKGGQARGQDSKGGQEGGMPGMTPEQQAEMEAWMKAGTPGPEHKNLEYAVGNWDVTCRSWMDPKGEPITSQGKSQTESIWDGRYILTSFTGDMMGMQFEGKGCMGYDNLNKRYFSAWIDSMSTMMMQDTGTYDAASKTFTYTGEMKDPVSGKMGKTRTIVKVNSKDEHVMTMYNTKAGESEQKVMELTFRRAGGAAGGGAR